MTEAQAEILDGEQVVASGTAAGDSKTVVSVPFNGKIKWWTPDEPNLYPLRVSLLSDSKVVDQREYPYGAKEFKLDDGGHGLGSEVSSTGRALDGRARLARDLG